MTRIPVTGALALGILLIPLAAFAQEDNRGAMDNEQPPAKEETPIGAPGAKKDDKGPAKKLTVFELVGKLLKIKVVVKGPKVKPDVAADIAGKIEGALKDCAVKEIQGNAKYLVNDDKLYRAKIAVTTKLEAGVCKKVKASVSGKSPIMKTCVGTLEGLETGYGEMSQQITASIDTGLK